MYPSLAEVKVLAGSGNYRRIPVCRELLADRFTPVEVMRTLRAASCHCYLLESAEDSQKWGRFSFLGYAPVAGADLYRRKAAHSFGCRRRLLPRDYSPDRAPGRRNTEAAGRIPQPEGTGNAAVYRRAGRVFFL